MNEKGTKELEKILTSLDGIEKARVIVDDKTGEMREIHILSSGDKNSKQIVRDIETAVLTITGERIDRRIISVAQINTRMSVEKPSIEEKKESEELLKIEAVGFSEDEMEIEVSVEITKGREMKEVTKHGVKSFKNVLKLSAEATIEAIESLMNSRTRISLDEIREVSTGERKFFLGAMTVLKSGGMSKELVFAGSIGFNAVRNVADAVVSEVNSMILNF